jgi:hypothetical protein
MSDESGLRISERRRGEKEESEDRAIGRSRGGLSTKIHMAVRGLGFPVTVRPERGSEGRCTASRGLDRGITGRGRHGRHSLGRRPLAPSHRCQGGARRHSHNPSRALKYPLDKHLYAHRRCTPNPRSSPAFSRSACPVRSC